MPSATLKTMEPNNPAAYDSRADEVLDWYKHYMSIEAGDLAGLVVNHLWENPTDASAALEEAARDRREEIEGVMRCRHNNVESVDTGHSGDVELCEDCGLYL